VEFDIDVAVAVAVFVAAVVVRETCSLAALSGGFSEWCVTAVDPFLLFVCPFPFPCPFPL